jgi:hypothetical protein
MPRYFFNIRDGSDLALDEEGIVLDDLSEAREEAILGARDIIIEKVRAGELIDGQEFEITDASGKILRKVPFREAIRLRMEH